VTIKELKESGHLFVGDSVPW